MLRPEPITPSTPRQKAPCALSRQLYAIAQFNCPAGCAGQLSTCAQGGADSGAMCCSLLRLRRPHPRPPHFTARAGGQPASGSLSQALRMQAPQAAPGCRLPAHMDAPCTAAAPAPARRTSHSGCANHMQHQDAPLCDLTLTQVLSWLGVPDLAGSAGIVCKQWHRASECKEVWRR